MNKKKSKGNGGNRPLNRNLMASSIDGAWLRKEAMGLKNVRRNFCNRNVKKKDEKMDEIFKNHGTIIRCATYVNKSKEEKEEKL